MNAERAFVSMLLFTAVVGVAFIGLAVGHAYMLGEPSAVMRHPLVGSGAAALAISGLGGLLLLTLRPRR
jgi:hypothetical protein